MQQSIGKKIHQNTYDFNNNNVINYLKKYEIYKNNYTLNYIFKYLAASSFLV